jgi:hypothetical protein
MTSDTGNPPLLTRGMGTTWHNLRFHRWGPRVATYSASSKMHGLSVHLGLVARRDHEAGNWHAMVVTTPLVLDP